MIAAAQVQAVVDVEPGLASPDDQDRDCGAGHDACQGPPGEGEPGSAKPVGGQGGESAGQPGPEPLRPGEVPAGVKRCSPCLGAGAGCRVWCGTISVHV